MGFDQLGAMLGLTPSMMDFLTGVLCLVMAVALSTLHILSGAKHGRWVTLPFYVRLGFILTAVGMLYRGTDLINLSKAQADAMTLGHIDPTGLLLTLSMTFTFVSLTIYAIRNSYSLRTRAEFNKLNALAHGPNGEALADLAFKRADLAVPLEAMAKLSGQGAKVVEPMGDMPKS